MPTLLSLSVPISWKSFLRLTPVSHTPTPQSWASLGERLVVQLTVRRKTF